MFPLVPGCTDPELGSPSRDDVKGGDSLGEQAGVAIRDARDEQPQPEVLSPPRHEPEGGVALEHRISGRRHAVHLEPVVHERECANPDGFGCARQRGDAWPDARGRPGPFEAGDVEIDLHLRVLPPESR